MHVDLHKRPVNQFKLVQQSWLEDLRAYCSDIYIVSELLDQRTSRSLASNKSFPIHFLLNVPCDTAIRARRGSGAAVAALSGDSGRFGKISL